MSLSTIQQHLAVIGIDVAQLSEFTNLNEEFQFIKKQYFKLILLVHPDKGGDKKEFIKINNSFEALRETFENNSISSFAKSSQTKTQSTSFSSLFHSWGFYFNASEQETPIYKVELARSGRSSCTQVLLKISFQLVFI